MNKRAVLPVNIDGIISYKPDISDNYENYHVAGLDKLNLAEKYHFWFITRRDRILNEFRKNMDKSARVLEIGAGTGFIARGLQDEGYDVAIGEIHLSGLKYAKKNGIKECYQFNLFEPPFKEEFDVVGLFDVVEHLSDDVSALKHVSKMLKPNGKLIITVPAHQWLWSRDDAIAAHKRRYSKKMLIHKAEEANLEILDVKYFFITILPLLYLRHLLNRDSEDEITDDERRQGFHINYLINKLLLILTMFENKVSKYLPNIFGGSLFLIGVKKPVKSE